MLGAPSSFWNYSERTGQYAKQCWQWPLLGGEGSHPIWNHSERWTTYILPGPVIGFPHYDFRMRSDLPLLHLRTRTDFVHIPAAVKFATVLELNWIEKTKENIFLYFPPPKKIWLSLIKKLWILPQREIWSGRRGSHPESLGCDMK